MRSVLIGFTLALLASAQALAGTAKEPVLVPADRAYGQAMVKFEQSRYRQPHEVVIYKVADVKSTTASEEAFAIELGYVLNKLTATNGVENCAEFFRAKDGSGFAARIITVGAHHLCPKVGLPFGEGYEPTGGDIHSHPHTTRYHPNEVDALFLNRVYGPRDYVYTTPEDFSPGDFESPGYMVNEYDIKYQSGEHHVRRVAKMDEVSIGTLVITQSFSADIAGIAPLANTPVAAATAVAPDATSAVQDAAPTAP